MATIKLEPKYEKISDLLVGNFRERGIVLSDYAEGLIRLSAESWFEEPLRLRQGTPVTEQRLNDLATQIIRRTIEESHIRQRMERKEKVPFSELLYALGTSGYGVVREILGKGF